MLHGLHRYLTNGSLAHDDSRLRRLLWLEAAALAAIRARGDGSCEDNNDADDKPGDGAAVGRAAIVLAGAAAKLLAFQGAPFGVVLGGEGTARSVVPAPARAVFVAHGKLHEAFGEKRPAFDQLPRLGAPGHRSLLGGWDRGMTVMFFGMAEVVAERVLAVDDRREGQRDGERCEAELLGAHV